VKTSLQPHTLKIQWEEGHDREEEGCFASSLPKNRWAARVKGLVRILGLRVLWFSQTEMKTLKPSTLNPKSGKRRSVWFRPACCTTGGPLGFRIN
jgi:hypothetical protein